MLLRKVSLLVHVSSSDELDTKVVSHDLGSSYFKLDGLGHSLEVLLISIHDNVFISSVVLLSELLPK